MTTANATRGIVETLARLAALAGHGMVQRSVRQWAMQGLTEGGFPTKTSACVEVLLAAVRKRCAWVPDPTTRETFMAPGELLLGETATGDADELAVLLAALLGSVGIRTQIIGYGYGEGGGITHVLVSYWDEAKREWVDVDPSVPESAPTPAFTRRVASGICSVRNP